MFMNLFLQYQSRSSNATKAQANWEKKSQYLLTEIVKYESYIDSLQAAMSLRLKRRGEKALEKALVVSSPHDIDNQITVKGKRNGDTALEESPSISGPVYAKFHRRETADGG
jgi:PH and SEC7 domain-containing protein